MCRVVAWNRQVLLIYISLNRLLMSHSLIILTMTSRKKCDFLWVLARVIAFWWRNGVFRADRKKRGEEWSPRTFLNTLVNFAEWAKHRYVSKRAEESSPQHRPLLFRSNGLGCSKKSFYLSARVEKKISWFEYLGTVVKWKWVRWYFRVFLI